jgi:glyoxylase-like metal-dependent hydrolase (beta-lactamase superfamily II)
VWMSRRTYEQAEQLLGGKYLANPDEAERFLRANGVEDVTTLKPMFSPGRLARLASGLPNVERFVADSQCLPMAPAWTALETNGHAEGHLCLNNADARLLISGDQVLPTISSNISFSWRNTDPNPLHSFLSSLQRLRGLPEDTLVLPSHGVPFRGLQQRIDDLVRHHEEQLETAVRACAEPRSGAELLPLMFRRKLIGMHLFLALGEALAHLEYLVHAGRLARIDGTVTRYCAAQAPRP